MNENLRLRWKNLAVLYFSALQPEATAFVDMKIIRSLPALKTLIIFALGLKIIVLVRMKILFLMF